MSTDSFSSKTISNSPSLNSASITVASINTQNLVGTSLTVSNLASSGFVNVGGDISCNGNIKSKSWNTITDISGSGNVYAKTLYLTGDISNNGNISTNGNLIVKGVNVGNSLSQWTTSGANVYYNGNVSVGKITNAYALDVSGSLNVGRIYQPTLPMVKAYVLGLMNFYAGNPSLTNGLISWNTLDPSFNNIGFTTGILNSTGGYFTCPIAGFYGVNILLATVPGNGQYYSWLYLYINSTLDGQSFIPENYFSNLTINKVMYLNVGDVVKASFGYAGGSSCNMDFSNGFFNIYYLRAG